MIEKELSAIMPVIMASQNSNNQKLGFQRSRHGIGLNGWFKCTVKESGKLISIKSENLDN